MTQKLETVLGAVMMIGAVLGGLALAALIMGLIPAVAGFQPPQRDSKAVTMSCEWPGVPLDWWGTDNTQSSVMPISISTTFESPITTGGKLGGVKDRYGYGE